MNDETIKYYITMETHGRIGIRKRTRVLFSLNAKKLTILLKNNIK